MRTSLLLNFVGQAVERIGAITVDSVRHSLNIINQTTHKSLVTVLEVNIHEDLRIETHHVITTDLLEELIVITTESLSEPSIEAHGVSTEGMILTNHQS
jgi:hypothetical protein